MSHTPGPWTVAKRRDGLCVCPNGAVLLGNHEEIQADVDLMAAAPDLLTALEELLALGQQESIEDGELEAAQEAARIAIKKARG